MRADAQIELVLGMAMGPFGTLAASTLGLLYEGMIANQTKEVVQIRASIYAAFAAGVVFSLTQTNVLRSKDARAGLAFRFGRHLANKLSAKDAYCLQLSLFERALTKPQAGWGLNGLYSPPRPYFPHDYIRHWSPDLLHSSFCVEIGKPTYLYKDPPKEK